MFEKKLLTSYKCEDEVGDLIWVLSRSFRRHTGRKMRTGDIIRVQQLKFLTSHRDEDRAGDII